MFNIGGFKTRVNYGAQCPCCQRKDKIVHLKTEGNVQHPMHQFRCNHRDCGQQWWWKPNKTVGQASDFFKKDKLFNVYKAVKVK